MSRKAVICLALILLNVIVFWRVAYCDFVYYDDNRFILNLPRIQQGLTWDNFKWAMTTQDLEYWHPLVWLSHMLDCQLFHLRPMGHHLMNLGFHVIGTVMLFLVLDRLTMQCWRSAIVAALFAIHPTHVESVAWISERKDVLTGPFFFATLAAYGAYARRPGIGRYAVVLLCFVLTLMCKPMGMTLPGVLLLMDFWPLRRASLSYGKMGIGEKMPTSPPENHDPATSKWTLVPWKNLLIEKIPLLAIAVVSFAFTLKAQKEAGTLAQLNQMSPEFRLFNAVTAYVRYIFKLVAPTNLSAFYPFPKSFAPSVVIAAAVLLAGATIAVLRWGRARPYLAIGWFWFLGTMLPTIGLVQVGPQSMADRYAYIPSIGFFIAVVWAVADAVRRRPYAARFTGAAAILVIAGFAAISWVQVGYWKNTEALFSHAAAVTDDNWLAQCQLANIDYSRGDYAAAVGKYQEVIRINPAYVDSYVSLGNCVAMVNPAAAIPYYRRAVEVGPAKAEGHMGLGNALAVTGNLEEAAAEYRTVLRLKPDLEPARRQLAQLEQAMKAK